MIPYQPSFLARPFAQNGDKNTIPDTGGDLLGIASLALGFPPITQTPLELGGIPPQRKDFNGILYALSTFAFFQQSGGVFTYSDTANYITPAVVMYDNVFYFCLKENGVDSANGVKDPTDTEYWIPLIDYLLESLAVGTPIGTIIMWASSNDPTDGGVWLDCDGQTFDTTTYAKLYAVLGTNTVPDLQGLFPRCVGSQDLSVTIDGTSTTQTFDGGSVGDKSADAIRNIEASGFMGERVSSDPDSNYNKFKNQPTGALYYDGTSKYGSSGGIDNDDFTGYFDASKVVPVGSENKPASVALRFLIKAK